MNLRIESEESYAERMKPPMPAPDVECEGCGGEAVHTGQTMFLCGDCQTKLAAYDILATNMHEFAVGVHNWLKHWRHQIPGEAKGTLRALFEQNGAQHLLAGEQEAYQNEIVDATMNGIAARQREGEGVEAA